MNQEEAEQFVMDSIFQSVNWVEWALLIIAIPILIYLLIDKSRKAKKENFEKRDY